VVQFQQHADTAIAYPRQEPQLPQRAPAVQQLSVQSSGGVQELQICPRRIDGRLEHVMPDVEPTIVDPQRLPAQQTRDVQTSAQVRDTRQTAIHALPDLL
jgi:hypothetical protein